VDVDIVEGNEETLRLEPEKKNIDVNKMLREFFKRHYLAQHMSLVILSNGIRCCAELTDTLIVSHSMLSSNCS